MNTFFSIALIILALACMAAVLVQAHRGGLGSIFGGGDTGGQYKTRRGLEKTLFQVTIGLYAAFFILVIINVFLLS